MILHPVPHVELKLGSLSLRQGNPDFRVFRSHRAVPPTWRQSAFCAPLLWSCAWNLCLEPLCVSFLSVGSSPRLLERPLFDTSITMTVIERSEFPQCRKADVGQSRTFTQCPVDLCDALLPAGLGMSPTARTQPFRNCKEWSSRPDNAAVSIDRQLRTEDRSLGGSHGA